MNYGKPYILTAADRAKVLIDKAIGHIEDFPWKDWPPNKVKDFLVMIKEELDKDD